MTEKIVRIKTDGYRGLPSGNVYIEPGEYTLAGATDLGAHELARDLGEYIVSIGKATVVEVAPEDETPAAPETGDAPPEGETAGQPDTWDVTPGEMDADALDVLTVAELREMAQQRGLPLDEGYVRKADLIALLLGVVTRE